MDSPDHRGPRYKVQLRVDGELLPLKAFIHDLIGGAVMGGLLSIVLASIVSTECFADRCIFRYLAICASLGAMAGIIVGIRLARQPAPERSPPQPGL